MKSYNLTIFNQSRVIAMVFLVPIFLVGSLLFGLAIMPNSYFWVVSILLFSGLSGLLYYFIKQDLNIDFEDDTLFFEWKKKLLFNYDKIESIPVSEIKTVVIDQDRFLRKIITSDREICISNGTLPMKDSQKFIGLLRSIINQNEGKIINSWDVWHEKGYLKWALRINTVIIILTVGLIIAFGIIKGFDKIPIASFVMLLFLVPQMLLYQRKMNK